MTTARESLAQQLHELMKGPPTPEGIAKVTELLEGFRVQAKAGTEVQPGVTARDSLGRAVVGLWKRGPKDLERNVDVLLDKYRMQVKKEGPASGPGAPGSTPPPAVGSGTGEAPPPPAPKPKPAPRPESAAKPEAPPKAAPAPARAAVPPPPAPPSAAASMGRRGGLPPARGPVSMPMAPRAAPQSVTPLFPGTPTGPSRRSECPKCKSRGVVLARTYAQEEYYSCIYCGWQAFKPFEETNTDAPLAARLLSQRPAAPKRVKEGGEEEGDDEDRAKRSVIVPDEDVPASPTVRPDEGEDDEAAEEPPEDEDLDDGEDDEEPAEDAGEEP